MRIAFVSEIPGQGKVPITFPNMRTECAWMHALNADHYNIVYAVINKTVKDYDHVFVVFPKGKTYLSAEGSRLIEEQNPASPFITPELIKLLRAGNNKKIHYVQEGPHWWFNDYEINDQINFYNMLHKCDSIFAHNESDKAYYEGLFPNKVIRTMQTLMIEELIKDIVPVKENKVIIGGNFARWYGGFESYRVAEAFNVLTEIIKTFAGECAVGVRKLNQYFSHFPCFISTFNFNIFKYAHGRELKLEQFGKCLKRIDNFPIIKLTRFTVLTRMRAG